MEFYENIIENLETGFSFYLQNTFHSELLINNKTFEKIMKMLLDMSYSATLKMYSMNWWNTNTYLKYYSKRYHTYIDEREELDEIDLYLTKIDNIIQNEYRNIEIELHKLLNDTEYVNEVGYINNIEYDIAQLIKKNIYCVLSKIEYSYGI